MVKINLAVVEKKIARNVATVILTLCAKNFIGPKNPLCIDTTKFGNVKSPMNQIKFDTTCVNE